MLNGVIIAEWNNLPQESIATPSLEAFKATLHPACPVPARQG